MQRQVSRRQLADRVARLARAPLARAGLALCLVASAPAGAQVPAPEPADAAAPGDEGPPASQAAPPTSSLGPDVYFEDVTIAMRDGLGTGFVLQSPHDPQTFIGASVENHVFLSKDGGQTYHQVSLPGLRRIFPGAGVAAHYPGALRRADSPVAGALPTHLGPSADPLTAGRLREWLRRAGRPAVGRASIASNLALRGAATASIWYPIFHPHDRDVFWAFTMDGLYVSEDGGWTFTRRWLGATPRGSRTFGMEADPDDDQHLLLCTGEGLHVSRDGGRSFLRHTGQLIGDWQIWSVSFHPTDHRYVFAQASGGLLRSADRGRTWQLVYWSAHPMGREVRSMAFDPWDPDHALIDTNDGMWETHRLRRGGREDWRRGIGAQFVGTQSKSSAFCPKHRGHLWTLSIPYSRVSYLGAEPLPLGQGIIYESLDGGSSWRGLVTGQAVGEVFWFLLGGDDDPDLLWIYGDGGTFRMRRGPRPDAHRGGPPTDLDPPVEEVIDAALRHTGTHVEHELSYRRRARWSALLPQVQAMFLYGRARDYAVLYDRLFATLPYRQRQFAPQRDSEWRVGVSWDFGPLVFSPHTPLSGREAGTLAALRRQIIAEVQQAHRRLRELRLLLAHVPRREVRLRVMQRLRIEESQAYLEELTGGFIGRWRARRAAAAAPAAR